MESPDLQQIKKEILQLIKQQVATLENLGFASASIAELQEFDARRARIYQLGEKLSRAAREAAESTDGISPLPENTCKIIGSKGVARKI